MAVKIFGRLALPEKPSDGNIVRYTGKWSHITKRIEPAGRAFRERWEEDLHKTTSLESNRSEYESTEDVICTRTDSQKSNMTPRGGDKKKSKKLLRKEARNQPIEMGKGKDSRECGNMLKISEFLVNSNLYEVLNMNEGESTDEIKKSYRRLLLSHHPDKSKMQKDVNVDKTNGILQKPRKSGNQSNNIPTDKGVIQHNATTNDPDGHLNFLRIQEAFEILSDEKKRLQYDSLLPFDEIVPKLLDFFGKEEEFYRVFQDAFGRYQRWSKEKPVPQFGDKSTPVAKIMDFYYFWQRFQSTRDFSKYDEHEIPEGMGRDEKRWCEKENLKTRRVHFLEEHVKIKQMVELAFSYDPRLKESRDSKKTPDVNRISKTKEKEKEKEKEKQERSNKPDKDDNIQINPTTGKLLLTGKDKDIHKEKSPIVYIMDGDKSNQIPCIKNSIKNGDDIINQPIRENGFLTGEWSKQELSILSKGLKKYTAGTVGRWNLIADMIRTAGFPRRPNDVAALVKTLAEKEHARVVTEKINSNADSKIKIHADKGDGKKVDENINKNKNKNKNTPMNSNIDSWSRDQQRQLESAIKAHPTIKEATEEVDRQRWNSISEFVEGMDPESCLRRFNLIKEKLRANRT